MSGHYVPQLSQLVYERNKGINNPAINLKGFLVCTMNILMMLIQLPRIDDCQCLVSFFSFYLMNFVSFRSGTLLLMIIMITLAHLSTGGHMV